MQWHIPHNAVRWFAYFFADSRTFGYCLLALAGGYVGISLLHGHALKVFSRFVPNYIWKLPVPPPKLTLYQIGIASADMLVAGAVFYMLCPHVRGGYMTVLEVYMVAFVLNVLSHVPGGWGVIEATIMTLLDKLDYVPAASMPRVLAAIVVFRVIYFLLPLLISVVLIGWHEYALRRNWIAPVVMPIEDTSADGQVPGMIANPQAEKA
jgi:phosphatidylglycerol lysyltransferase